MTDRRKTDRHRDAVNLPEPRAPARRLLKKCCSVARLPDVCAVERGGRRLVVVS